MEPLVSIILPTHNRKKYVERAIKSALDQSYKNVELIVIDDCSTDGTEINNPRVIIVRNETNLGLARSLNKAIRIAKGKYIARLDDDDFWCDDKKLEKQVNFLEKNSEYGLVGGGVIRVDKEEKEVVRYLLLEKDEEIRKAILVDNVFAHTTALFRKDVWKKVGGYDENLDGLEDIDLWLKIGEMSKFYNFQEFFVCYLFQGRTYLDQHYGKLKQLKLNIKLRKKHKNSYSGYRKAILLSYASYFHSLIPFKKILWPILFGVRKLIFGNPPYRYFKK